MYICFSITIKGMIEASTAQEGSIAPSQVPMQMQPMMPGMQPTYSAPSQIDGAIEWLLNNPSIPLSMRQQFFPLWEIVSFGNYKEKDMTRLMLKFKEWTILVRWYLPDKEWGINIVFKSDANLEADAGGTDKVLDNIQMDWNLLFNTLEHMYYIQLTRGRDGFTVKELNPGRQTTTIKEPVEKKKSIFRIF